MFKNIISVSTIFVLLFSTSLSVASSTASLFDKKVHWKTQSGKVVQLTVKQAALQQGVPKRPLELAIDFFNKNSSQFDNKKFISIVDFRIKSDQKRLFIIEVATGKVEAFLVAHGKGSDPQHSGFAHRFSNTPQSHMSSLGFYQISETYDGKHGYSARMDGLSTTNSNARQRAVVIHGADYVNPQLNPIGRSFGCPAIEPRWARYVIDKIKFGSLYFIYAEEFEKHI